jgi:hypothetical protein
MFNNYKIFKKELERVRKDEPYYHSHGSVWKYFFRWKKLITSNSVKERLPWINFVVIDFLEKNIDSSSKVFEFGGGGSTLFFLDKGAEVATCEHNREWFNILTEKVGMNKQWSPLFVEPEPVNDFDISKAADPDKYFSTEKEFSGRSFRPYAASIDKYPDAHFDLVLVDGRARPSCIKHGIPKIKKGGYLVLDNSDRAYYTEYLKKTLDENFESVINYSAPTPFCDWFNRTTVWRKK